jgi:hypothetical protein
MAEDDSRQAATDAEPAVPVLVLNYRSPPSAPTITVLPFRSYLAGSILAVVLVPPIGIVAVVLSVKAKNAYRAGEEARARILARRAAHWGMAAFALTLLWLLTSCVIGVLVNNRWGG